MFDYNYIFSLIYPTYYIKWFSICLGMFNQETNLLVYHSSPQGLRLDIGCEIGLVRVSNLICVNPTMLCFGLNISHGLYIKTSIYLLDRIIGWGNWIHTSLGRFEWYIKTIIFKTICWNKIIIANTTCSSYTVKFSVDIYWLKYKILFVPVQV